MEALLVRRPRVEKGRSRRMALSLMACAAVLALAMPSAAQSLDTRPTRTPAQQDSPRRARTLRPERSDWAKRDYAEALSATSLSDGPLDTALLETRIRDLSAKVKELNDLLQRQKEAAEPVHFGPRPMRFTLLERDQPPSVAKTYGEALEIAVRDRVRALRAMFNDAKERMRLAIDPEPAEVRHLLEPIEAWLGAAGTPEEKAYAHLLALIYETLLEARAKIDCPERLPAAHKILHDLHVDRAALTEHLRRSFLLDDPTVKRDLEGVLAATGAMYPEPPAMRDFLVWLAESLGSDLKDELLRKAAFPYRGSAQGQFDAAAENATDDHGRVLRLQLDLQRMLVEAKGLRASNRVEEGTADTWQHRLLHAEREIDRLLRAADSEREAVMSLARRAPMERETSSVAEPAVESLTIEPVEAVASDGLTTQH